MVRGRQLTAGEGRFGVGFFENEWLHRLEVEKQGGTAHVSVKRSCLRPAYAHSSLGYHRYSMPGAIFAEETTHDTN